MIWEECCAGCVGRGECAEFTERGSAAIQDGDAQEERDHCENDREPDTNGCARAEDEREEAEDKCAVGFTHRALVLARCTECLAEDAGKFGDDREDDDGDDEGGVEEAGEDECAVESSVRDDIAEFVEDGAER
jgi:hypothetical protein